MKMNAAMLMLAAALQLPIPIQWQFDGATLSNKTYIADLDYIKANTDVDVINIAPVTGAAPEGNRLFHDALKELVEQCGMSFAFSPNGGDWRVRDTGSKLGGRRCWRAGISMFKKG